MSGGIVGVLVAFGVGADVALVSVLAYRSVAIWVPAGIGVATLPSLRATLAALEGARRGARRRQLVAASAPIAQLGRPRPPAPCRSAREPIAA